jgi:dienelactone hydrolase
MCIGFLAFVMRGHPVGVLGVCWSGFFAWLHWHQFQQFRKRDEDE